MITNQKTVKGLASLRPSAQALLLSYVGRGAVLVESENILEMEKPDKRFTGHEELKTFLSFIRGRPEHEAAVIVAWEFMDTFGCPDSDHAALLIDCGVTPNAEMCPQIPPAGFYCKVNGEPGEFQCVEYQPENGHGGSVWLRDPGGDSRSAAIEDITDIETGRSAAL